MQNLSVSVFHVLCLLVLLLSSITTYKLLKNIIVLVNAALLLTKLYMGEKRSLTILIRQLLLAICTCLFLCPRGNIQGTSQRIWTLLWLNLLFWTILKYQSYHPRILNSCAECFIFAMVPLSHFCKCKHIWD